MRCIGKGEVLRTTGLAEIQYQPPPRLPGALVVGVRQDPAEGAGDGKQRAVISMVARHAPHRCAMQSKDLGQRLHVVHIDELVSDDALRTFAFDLRSI